MAAAAVLAVRAIPLRFGGLICLCVHGGFTLLVLHPGGEVLLVERNRPLAHVRVREPAELCALARKVSGCVRLNLVLVNTTGYCVLLAVEGRNPERVDHVPAGLTEQHTGAGRYHQLTRGDDGLGDAVLLVRGCGRVGVLPPPLLAGDVHRHLTAVGVRDLHDRPGGEGPDRCKDDEGDDCQHDLERRLAVGLLGNRLTLVSELGDGVPHRKEDEHADDARHEEHRPLEVVDLSSRLPLGLPRVLRGVP
ncbi:unannotated protein [freshwater metagenome]|uniref:Unannotated protein n=1 Tax=freshwater metagenome TaxID=449393 RepID=A0A6J7EBZ7_9ZZZZ